uniref:AlNc14C86G5498 protein n=1 Tax=Albugo laibachii Nc14 TaxID=890382 RepID=F0WFW3_9STRA|nr:AlNc14C86G5498 [Albugo laibachii Nc14]|eukprot:CCA20097.1 AlNc14C86G5498 [Albugo laibachii Nc14]
MNLSDKKLIRFVSIKYVPQIGSIMQLEARETLGFSRSVSSTFSSSWQSCERTTNHAEIKASKGAKRLQYANESDVYSKVQSESTNTCLWGSFSSSSSFPRKSAESVLTKGRIPLNYRLQEEQHSLLLKLDKLFSLRDNDSSLLLDRYHHSVTELLDTHFYNVLKIERESTQTHTKLHEHHSLSYNPQITRWRKHAQQTLKDLAALESIHQNLEELTIPPTKPVGGGWRKSSLQVLKQVWDSFPTSESEVQLAEETEVPNHSYFEEEFCSLNTKIEEIRQTYEELREEKARQRLTEGIPSKITHTNESEENGRDHSPQQQHSHTSQHGEVTSLKKTTSSKRSLKKKQARLRDINHRNECTTHQSTRNDCPQNRESRPSSSSSNQKLTSPQPPHHKMRYQSLTKTSKAKEKVKSHSKPSRPWR